MVCHVQAGFQFIECELISRHGISLVIVTKRLEDAANSLHVSPVMLSSHLKRGNHLLRDRCIIRIDSFLIRFADQSVQLNAARLHLVVQLIPNSVVVRTRLHRQNYTTGNVS